MIKTPENKPESFYDFEARMKRKINGGQISAPRPKVKTEPKSESAKVNELGIPEAEFKRIISEWKEKNPIPKCEDER